MSYWGFSKRIQRKMRVQTEFVIWTNGVSCCELFQRSSTSKLRMSVQKCSCMRDGSHAFQNHLWFLPSFNSLHMAHHLVHETQITERLEWAETNSALHPNKRLLPEHIHLIWPFSHWQTARLWSCSPLMGIRWKRRWRLAAHSPYLLLADALRLAAAWPSHQTKPNWDIYICLLLRTHSRSSSAEKSFIWLYLQITTLTTHDKHILSYAYGTWRACICRIYLQKVYIPYPLRNPCCLVWYSPGLFESLHHTYPQVCAPILACIAEWKVDAVVLLRQRRWLISFHSTWY